MTVGLPIKVVHLSVCAVDIQYTPMTALTSIFHSLFRRLPGRVSLQLDLAYRIKNKSLDVQMVRQQTVGQVHRYDKSEASRDAHVAAVCKHTCAQNKIITYIASFFPDNYHDKQRCDFM